MSPRDILQHAAVWKEPLPFSAARVIFSKTESDHATSLLEISQWLPTALWIKSKLLVTTLKALQDPAPPTSATSHPTTSPSSWRFGPSTFWQCRECAQPFPTSGPLHLPFSLPQTIFPRSLNVWLVNSHPSGLRFHVTFSVWVGPFFF